MGTLQALRYPGLHRRGALGSISIWRFGTDAVCLPARKRMMRIYHGDFPMSLFLLIDQMLSPPFPARLTGTPYTMRAKNRIPGYACRWYDGRE